MIASVQCQIANPFT